MTFLQRSHICQTCKKPKVLKGEVRQIEKGMPLTFREKQIAALVATGKSNKEIGNELHITEGTVKTFCNPLFRKAGVNNRTALAAWWIRQGDNTHKSE